MRNESVTVVVVVHGDRWKFLSQSIGSILSDSHIAHLIIVDNNSSNQKEITDYASDDSRIIHLRHERNLGSAGGFRAGILRARETNVDYVLLMDDDMIPEDGYIDLFLQTKSLLKDKVVLMGHRPEVLNNDMAFYRQTKSSTDPNKTFFEIFSLKKIIHFFRILFGRNKKDNYGPFVPIIPTEGFYYGGTLIPIDAVRRAEPPNEWLFLYGDDAEYSWNVKALGYEVYLCSRPTFKDIDFTFAGNQSHLFAQFDRGTSAFKVYFRLRNMVFLSRNYSKQPKIILFLNIIVWVLGLCLLGFTRHGLNSFFFKRCHLLWLAVIGGYYPSRPLPQEVHVP